MKYKYLFIAMLVAPLLLTACGGGGDDNDNDSDNNYSSSDVNSNTLTTPSAGRLLASQCAQCHGTDGRSVSRIDSLAGESGEILEEMFEMKGRDRNRVMHLQAKGYTDAEIREIAKYFSTLYQGGGRGSDRDNDRDDDRRYGDDDRYDDDDDDRYDDDRYEDDD